MKIISLCLYIAIIFPATAYCDLLISKSVFVNLADPNSLAFQKKEYSYFPAGTRLIQGGKAVNYRGSKRHLVYSENGIAAYIKNGLFWGRKTINRQIEEGGDNWVYISRKTDITVDISNKVKLVISFSRGEKYPLAEEDEESFSIIVGKNKIPKLGGSITLQVKIPRKNAKLVDLTKPLTKKEAEIYRLSIVDGISGIKKPCMTKQIIATKYAGKISASAGFSLKAFWAELTSKGDINASKEVSKLEEFEKDENVSREYYTRNGQHGVYKLTRYQSCSGNQDIKFIYTGKSVDEVTISKEWAIANNIPLYKTRKILVTCPEQYFKYYDELFDRDFDEDEIPFIISHTAKFKSLKSSHCSLE